MGKVWSYLLPSDDAYQLQAGSRYATFLSLSKSWYPTNAELQDAAAAHGIDITYLWQQGQPSRDTFNIDSWIAKQGDDPNSSHRWVYAEANVTKDMSLPTSSPWPTTIFSVRYVWVAKEGSPLDPPEPAPPPPAAPGVPGWAWFLGGALVVGGLWWATRR